MSVGIQAPRSLPPITPEDLTNLGVEPQFIPFIVSTTLRDEQSSDGSPLLNTAKAENLVETLHKVVSSPTVNPNLRLRCFRVLRKVSHAYGVLPKSYFLPEVTLSDTIAYASGGFSDIWKGQQGGNQVCIKAFRTQMAVDPDRIKRSFYREIIAWKYVSHPNVLPFLGVSETLFPFCIVSPWLPNGNILKYTQEHRGSNRLQLLAQAARGLEYLHSQGIVHSNINPGNILITEEGNACLGDFGITGIVTNPSVVHSDSTTTSKPGVVRYMAPELLNPTEFGLENSNPSKESDVYSLAMTAFEILSGVLPYGSGREALIAFQIASAIRPPRPNNTTAGSWLLDPIWNTFLRCWDQNPQSRPPIRSLHQALVESEMEQKRNTPVTGNGEAKIHISDSPAFSPPEPAESQPDDPPSSEEDNLVRGEEPSTESPGEHPNPPLQRSPLKRNLVKEALAGARRLIKRISRRRRRAPIPQCEHEPAVS